MGRQRASGVIGARARLSAAGRCTAVWVGTEEERRRGKDRGSGEAGDRHPGLPRPCFSRRKPGEAQKEDTGCLWAGTHHWMGGNGIVTIFWLNDFRKKTKQL